MTIWLYLYLSIHPFQHHRRPGRQIQFQPTLTFRLVQRIVLGEVRHGTVHAVEPAECMRVGVEHDLIFALRHEESVVGEGFARVEVEDKQQLLAAVSQHQVAIAVPHFLYFGLLEIVFAFDDFDHLAVKITKVVVFQVVIVHQVPLATGVFA